MLYKCSFLSLCVLIPQKSWQNHVFSDSTTNIQRATVLLFCLTGHPHPPSPPALSRPSGEALQPQAGLLPSKTQRPRPLCTALGVLETSGEKRGSLRAARREISVFTSIIGLDARTLASMLVSLAEPPTVAKKRMAYLAETVFPAPDSPLTMMDWFFSSLWQQKRKTFVNQSVLLLIKRSHRAISLRLHVPPPPLP